MAELPAEPPAELPTGSSGSVERFVEEELPPGFWEEANEPDGPPRPSALAAEGLTHLPGPAPADPSSNHAVDEDTGVSDTEPAADRAFTDLQQLFPGRVIAIEAHDNDADGAETAGEEPANEENDDDGRAG